MNDQQDAHNGKRRARRRPREAAAAKSSPQVRVETALRQRVFKGEWAVGACLPPARALAKEFGVSHSTANRALAFLQREGLLIGHQGKGHYVAGRPPRSVTRSIAVVTATANALEHLPTIQQLAGIRSVLNEDGYHLILASIQPRHQPPRHFSHIYDPRPVIDVSAADAAIVLGIPGGHVEPLYILARHLPVVNTFHRLHGPGIGSCIIDYAKAGFLAVRHLAELGHRELAFVCTDDSNSASANMREGAQLAALVHPDTRVESYFTGFFLPEEGEKAARDLLARPKPPTAVICGSCELTLGFWRAAAALGAAVPERLSLVTINDFLTTAEVPLPLTAVAMDHARFGRQTARMALDLTANPELNPPTQRLDVELRVRDSTRPPPAER